MSKRRHSSSAVLLGLGLILLLPLQAMPTVPVSAGQAPSTRQGSWTFMVYLDGDNNLETAGLDDFLEMATAGSDANLNIVVLFDRYTGDGGYGAWTTAKLFLVTPGMEPWPAQAIADWGEVNMGDPQTAIDFVNWARTNYPADHYALVYWDHGSGWLHTTRLHGGGTIQDVCDDWTNGDSLSSAELHQIMDTTTGGGADPVDLVGFDACLMAMWEVDNQVAPFSQVSISSEDTEPWDGWPYDTILGDLKTNPTWPPSQLGYTVVERYYQSYGNSETQSAKDVDAPYTALNQAVDDLALAMIAYEPTYHGQYDAARNASQSFYGYIDLYDLALQINAYITEPDLNAAASAVMSAVDNAVIHERHGPSWPGAHGISFYFPTSLPDNWPAYQALQSSLLTHWDEFLSYHITGEYPQNLIVDPPALQATLLPGEIVTHTLWITNNGATPLTFTLHELSRTQAVRSTPALRRRADPLVDPAVWAALETQSTVQVLIYLRELADLSPAYAIDDWAARGGFVHRTLQETAARSGGALRAWLEQAGAEPQVLLAANAIAATVDAAMLQAIGGRPEIARIGPNALIPLPPVFSAGSDGVVQTVEWNIAQIAADQVWTTFGVTGEGVTVGIVDTGALYTHAALAGQYRGNLGGGSFDHNYHWFDFVGGQPEPYDNNGHGTMGIGLMVGDDGGSNQIGVAPGAQWIAVKACDTACPLAALHNAMDWMLAPTNLAGSNPNPALRPQVGLGMWGGGSCDSEFLPDLLAWHAANILPVFSPGGSGPSCNTIGSPADLPQAFAAGATDSSDVIAPFSSRGPSCWGQIKPDVAAPGVNVRSSNNDGGYSVGSGTSWSAAHLAGTAALVLSADPSLSTIQVRQTITSTALCIEDLSCGGTPCPDGGNNVYGWGRIDAFEAVSLTLGGAGYNIPWLSEDPVSGTLDPGEGMPIAVAFDATGLVPDLYLGQLDVASSDPATPHLYIPVTLTVASDPAIVVAPPALETTLYPDGAATHTLWISNVGGTDLTFLLHELSRTEAVRSTPPMRPRSDPLVDPALWTRLERDGQTRALIYLRELADLSPAYAIDDWAARGRFVHRTLQETAARSGGALWAWLEQAGAEPRVLLAANAIAATVDAAMLQTIGGRPEVAHIRPDAIVWTPPLEVEGPAPEVVEWNIAQIGADQVWDTFGVTGQGVTVGVVDTGVFYTHAALLEQYRGNLGGGSFDHNYHWFDFANGQPEPYDDNGHGTMAIGFVLGDDGGANQIGVAPGAQWIAVKVDFSYEDLHAALDWMLAPTNLAGSDPDPAMRPQVGLNPWNGPGCSTEFQPDLQAWRAAGIVPVFRPGSNGPACATMGSPGDLPEAFTAAATDANDMVSSSASRGPSCWGQIKPEAAAPGVNVRSSYNDGGYSVGSGTSWSIAHLAGAAAMVLSADPTLEVAQVEAILTTTAVPRPDAQCGLAGPPNNVYGWGRIDVLEAVSLTLGGAGYDIPWLSEDPISGTVIPDAGMPIAVTFDATGLEPGLYQGQLDVASNDPDTPHLYVPVTLTVVPSCIPVTETIFSWDPLTPTAGQTIAFTAQAAGTPEIAFAWEFGDGSSGSGITVSHSYTSAGEYVVLLTATNDCGTQAVSATLTVHGCTPVSETIVSWDPMTPTAGQAVTFTAQATGTPEIAFAWEFGDGSSASGQTVSHLYAHGGIYSVILSATNACGRQMVSAEVTVEQDRYVIYLPLVWKGEVLRR